MGEDITIRIGRWPEDEALIVDLHMRGYAEEDDRFSRDFGRHVAETVEDARKNAGARSRVWFAEKDGETVGCTAMVDRGDRGQLRWVVLMPAARGCGVGGRLFSEAMDYAAAQDWREVFLETVDGLPASMAMYRKAGFEEVSNKEVELWHGKGRAITMVKPL